MIAFFRGACTVVVNLLRLQHVRFQSIFYAIAVTEEKRTAQSQIASLILDTNRQENPPTSA